MLLSRAWSGSMDKARTRHTYILGMSGSGKSVTMEMFLYRDVRKGHGIALIEPHGELADRFLHFDLFRLDHKGQAHQRLVLLDLESPEPTPFNIFRIPLPSDPVSRAIRIDELAASFLQALKLAIRPEMTEGMEAMLRNAITAVFHLTQQGDSIDLDRLADVFRARIGDLIFGVWRLAGHRDGNNFVCPNPLRADRTAGSFRIGVGGKFQGMVTDFAGEAVPGTGKKSVSALSFHIALMHSGDKNEGVRWAKDWAGFTGKAPDSLRVSREALDKFDNRPQESEEDIKKKRGRSLRIYLDKTTAWMNTPAQYYYAGRGIDLDRLPFMANAPRYKEKCFCGELGKPGTDPEAYLPAIILPYVAMDGTFLAVHRTYLRRTDDGGWVKAAIKRAKRSYGSYAGGVIHLWNGSHVLKRTGEVAYGRPLSKADGPIRVHLCEGPEDGWSVALAYPDERVDAAGSVSNMGGLAYPEKVTEIVIWKQADPPGSPADKEFRKAVKNFKDQGKRVMVADVTSVMAGAKDANDVLKGAK
ncbi:DUF7146 domain-containing protein [Magnetospirillum moscoviense]|nr:DUF87 domain-containing protein [Magnetospirillum moscoviense]